MKCCFNLGRAYLFQTDQYSGDPPVPDSGELPELEDVDILLAAGTPSLTVYYVSPLDWDNIGPSGLQIDGVNLSVGDRVLVKDATDGKLNRIWVVQHAGVRKALNGGAGHPAVLALVDNTYEDWDNGTPPVCQDHWVNVTNGTVNSGKDFEITTSDPITLGTTSITWAEKT